MKPSTWFKAALAALATLALMVSVTPVAAQQTGTVTGTVTESGSGRALAGVQVFLTGRGARGPTTVTGQDGMYRLANVPAGQVQVRARLVGFTSQSATLSLTAGGTADLDFSLSQSVIALDEIVVTGAGAAQSKKQLGNTIATVNSAAIANAPVTSFSEAISAREAGVVVTPQGGIAGEGARIRIRGTASLAMSNEPVVYVDGVRIDPGDGFSGIGAGGGGYHSAMDNINPEAIERVEILKGAAAASLYGSEASAGVIHIFTKKGSSGAPRFNFRIDQGFSQYPEGRIKPNAGFPRDAAQAADMNALFGTSLAPFDVVEREFTNSLLGTGYNYTFSADVAGGSDDFQYYVAGRLNRDDGAIDASDLGPGANDNIRRIQGSAQFTMFPRDRLSFRLSTQFTDTQQQLPNNNNNIYGLISSAMFGKPELANCDESGVGPGNGSCTGAGNPFGNAAFGTTREGAQRESVGNTEHFNSSATLTYNAAQTLNLDLTLGLDVTNQNNFAFSAFGNDVDNFTNRNDDGFRDIGKRNHRELTVDLRSTWTERFGSISSTLVLGGQGFISRNKTSGGTGRDFPGPGIEVAGAGAQITLNEGFQEQVNIGLLFQEQLGFNDWIYLTGGGRWDRNSAFGDSTNGQFYPKIGVSVIPSDLLSWSSETLSSFRVRAAFGKSGQQPGAFDRFTTFSSLSSSNGPGLQPSNLGNDNLAPEVSEEIELGGELGLFNNRASIDITYWDRKTTDALVARQFVVSGGFLNTQLDNIGQLDAHGWELKFNALALDRENLSIDLFANAAFLREQVTSMGGASPIKVGGSYPRYRNFLIGPDTLASGEVLHFAPGVHLGAQLIPTCGSNPTYTKGPRAGQGRICYTPGSTVPYDTDGNGQPDDLATFGAFLQTNPGLSDNAMAPMVDDEDDDGDVLDHRLGKPTPDWSGAFGANITLWRNLQLNSLFEFKTGDFFVNNLTDAFRNSHALIGRNTPAGARVEATISNPGSSEQDKIDAAMTWATELRALAPLSGLNTIKNAKFLRFRELGLTYSAPQAWSDKLGLSNLAFNVTGRNIALWTPYDGVDPETNAVARGGGNQFLQSVEAFGVPVPRRYTFSVRFGF